MLAEPAQASPTCNPTAAALARNAPRGGHVKVAEGARGAKRSEHLDEAELGETIGSGGRLIGTRSLSLILNRLPKYVCPSSIR